MSQRVSEMMSSIAMNRQFEAQIETDVKTAEDIGATRATAYCAARNRTS